MIGRFRRLRALINRTEPAFDELHRLGTQLNDLRQDVDYVRHVAEQARANAGAAARGRSPRNPVRVLFLVHHLEAWYSLAGVYEAMAEADDFAPLVASIPRRFPGSDSFQDEELVHEGLGRFGVPHVRFREDDSFQDLAVARAFGPDLIFRQSQWDHDVPEAFNTVELAFARLCLVPYEPMGLIDSPVDIYPNPGYNCPYYRNAWRVFLANDLARAEVQRHAVAICPDQLAVTGHPKSDRLLERLGAVDDSAPRPFTVLWSAHHSLGDDWARFGTFHTAALEMVEMARSHPHWRFVLSLHPALTTQLTAPRPPLSQELVETFWREWQALPNTSLFPGGDYAPVFAHSDALVCDGLSWLLEYQLAGKPVIFIERPDHHAFNALGELAYQGMIPVPTVAAAAAELAKVAAGEPFTRAETQREVVAALFGDRGAPGRILDAIRVALAEEGD